MTKALLTAFAFLITIAATSTAHSQIDLKALPSDQPKKVQPVKVVKAVQKPELDKAKMEWSELAIQTKEGKSETLRIELAVNDKQREKGLMFRTQMDDDAGMLFDFGKSREIYMWMKNTYIPLDMVFIKEDGTIHHLVRKTTPLSKTLIGSAGPIRFVLEVKAGTIDKLGIQTGAKLQHHLFTSN